ncbi:hypothetical protein KAJ89_05235 [Candidatus Parcubacteria bacterium]|nr:hypothetical protein [Candidatus Parcubacteria bacterium]
MSDEEEYKYINDIKGDVEKFSGKEEIFYKKKLVYSLVYNGKVIIHGRHPWHCCHK